MNTTWPRVPLTKRVAKAGLKPKLIVISVNSSNEASTVLEGMEATIMKCQNEIYPGLFSGENLVRFFM